MTEENKDYSIDKIIEEIDEQTAVSKESLLLNGYAEVSNSPDYMYKTIEERYVLFRRNEKGLYNPTNSCMHCGRIMGNNSRNIMHTS